MEGGDAWSGALVGDRYVLRGTLGRGATSVVWRATHEALTRDYAVKILDPKATAGSPSTATEVEERFRFEALVCCRLGTDAMNIVAVHDAGVFRGRPYMVMDLVRGESVQARLKREAMGLEEVGVMLRDVATALTICHREGIAHRDTKPANILRSDATGRYKLADFGLAKLFGEAPPNFFVPRETVGSMLVGTPAYMCPEAISADRTISGACDVWALAVTLYECLFGVLPFAGEGWPAVAVSIMKRRFRLPSEIDAVHAPFDALFAQAFAQDAFARFQTPGELVEAFEAATASSAPLLVEPVTPLGDSPSQLATRDLQSASDHQLVENFEMDSLMPARPPKRAHARFIAVAAVLVGAITFVLARAGEEAEARRVRIVNVGSKVGPTPRALPLTRPPIPSATKQLSSTANPSHATPARRRSQPSASAAASSTEKHSIAKPFDPSEIW